MTHGLPAFFAPPLRRLRRDPLSASMVVAILGLTLGSAALVFTLVDALLLDPLPFQEPERLVRLGTVQGGESGELSMRELRDIHERTALFTDIAAYRPPRGGYTMGGSGTPLQASAVLVSHNLFSVLGVAPAIGSSFPASYDLERSFGIVMSDRLFRAQLGGDQDRLDDVLTLDGAPNYRVFGVMPAGFDFPVRTELYRSIYINERNPNLEDRSARVALGVARLEPGVAIDTARASLEALSRQLAADHPDTNRGVEIELTPLEEVYTGDLTAYLWILGLGVGALLVIGCVVTSNLLQARALPRENELAVRAALGASRLHLGMQVLADGLVLCATGALVGLGLAYGGMKTLPALIRLDLPSWQRLEMDASTPVFGLGLALATALFAGAGPAWRLARTARAEGLRPGVRVSAGLHRRRLGRMLVTAQAALAFVLLAATSTLILGFLDLSRADLGFAPDRVASFKVNLPWFLYSRREPAKLDGFHRDVLAELEALPASEAAALTSDLPFTEGAGAWLEPYFTEERPLDALETHVRLRRATVSPSLFDVLDIPVLEGRTFDPGDRADTRPVAIISRRAADLLWPGEPAVGKRLRPAQDPDQPWREVVGVVGDVRRQLASSAWQQAAAIYLPAAQTHPANVHFVLRVRDGFAAEALRRDVEQVVLGVDPLQPIWDVETMDRRFETQLWREKAVTWLVSIFAFAAVLIATGGLYALLAQSVRQRRREIGVRKALGADANTVVRLVLADAGRIVILALALGGLAAFAALKWLAYLLAFLDRPSPLVLAATAGGLAAVALLAALAPAWRHIISIIDADTDTFYCPNRKNNFVTRVIQSPVFT
ncbi:MAG: ABC transporter permease, partial [Holophagales bacterium]|nr:ABC transporter permease [Holophagales bacterium]